MGISVILPCYKGAATLAVQLEALTRQTYRGEWELLFGDNGSTDGSLALLDGFRPRLPSTRVVQVYGPTRGRRGVAFSYAVAMAASDADAFVLCEADDEVADDWLDHMARALERHDLVAAAIDYDKLHRSDLMQGPSQRSRERGLARNSGPLHLPYVSGCALGLRRSVIDRIGPPSEEIGSS